MGYNKPVEIIINLYQVDKVSSRNLHPSMVVYILFFGGFDEAENVRIVLKSILRIVRVFFKTTETINLYKALEGFDHV